MKDKISAFLLGLLFGTSGKIIYVLIFSSIFIIYYGIYALSGNKVITKTNGMIYLSTEASAFNILIGIIFISFVFIDKSDDIE